MAIEYSAGYIDAARKKLKKLEALLSPEAIAIARQIADDLSKSSTPARVA